MAPLLGLSYLPLQEKLRTKQGKLTGSPSWEPLWSKLLLVECSGNHRADSGKAGWGLWLGGAVCGGTEGPVVHLQGKNWFQATKKQSWDHRILESD